MSKKDIYELVLPRLEKGHKERLEEELEVIEQYGLETDILSLYNVINQIKEKNVRFYTFAGDNMQSMLVLYLLGVTPLDPTKYGIRFYRVPYLLKKTGRVYSLFISTEEGVRVFNQGINKFKIFEIETKAISTSFEECCALFTLNRPGPIEAGYMNDFIKRSLEKEDYSLGCKEFDEPLKDTYGVFVYYDQMVEIIKNIMDVNDLEAETIRRNMVKCIPKLNAEYKVMFLNSKKLECVDPTLREKLWELIYTAAEYCLHKGHVISVVPTDFASCMLFKYDMLCHFTESY
jgi:DNA polymerase III alpha subunit